jgi:hypothetical protein
MLFLLDALLSTVANRFWGKCSFIDNQWYNLANFIATIILLADAFK